ECSSYPRGGRCGLGRRERHGCITYPLVVVLLYRIRGGAHQSRFAGVTRITAPVQRPSAASRATFGGAQYRTTADERSSSPVVHPWFSRASPTRDTRSCTVAA